MLGALGVRRNLGAPSRLARQYNPMGLRPPIFPSTSHGVWKSTKKTLMPPSAGQVAFPHMLNLLALVLVSFPLSRLPFPCSASKREDPEGRVFQTEYLSIQRDQSQICLSVGGRKIRIQMPASASLIPGPAEILLFPN